MRQFIYLAEALNEAPIGDINVIGEPQPIGRNGEFTGQHKFGKQGFTPGDKTLLTNPKSVKKIRDAFDKTPFLFDFYVFIDGSVKPDLPWSQAKLEKELGQPIDPTGKITVVYTNNSTNTSPGSYMPMNAWALAHRMAHDFHINHRHPTRENLAEDVAWAGLCAIWNAAFGGTKWGEYTPKKELFTRAEGGPMGQAGLTLFANFLLTMRSARNLKINNELDVFPELFAQYLLTGRVRLNRVAQWDMEGYLNAMPMMGDTVVPTTKHAEIDHLIAQTETEIEQAITGLLQSMVGKVYGW